MASFKEKHACGIVGEHVAACEDCGTVTLLGWAHLCRDCWERAIREPDSQNGGGPVR